MIIFSGYEVLVFFQFSRRSVKDFVHDDDDDIELVQENRILRICHFPNESEKIKRLKNSGKSTKMVEQSGVSDDEGLLFDDIFGEEEAAHDNEENEMANFIVDDGISYGDRSPMRCFKMNQKKLKQVVTLCSSALNDVGPIIGDVNEILNRQKQVMAINVKLDDSSEFEPFFLADKYMTERDNHVRETDMPERMQMIEEIVGPLPLDEMSREEESAWILNQLVMNSDLLFCTKRTTERSGEGSFLLNKIKKADIMKFLELHHVEKFDIPFIAMYRKEQCRSLLDDIEQDEADSKANNDAGRACQLKWHKVLWVIKELDRKWLLHQKRKSALQLYQRRRYDEECVNIDYSESYTLNKQLFQSISKSLNEAESEEEIDDVDAKFSLHFPPVEERMDGKFKRPLRKSQYSNCMKAGLWKLASQFGYTSEQLGLQIALEKMDVDFQEYPEESPEEIALNYTCTMFETPERVLKGARHMAALEVSCDPCIKKHIRSIFMNKAVISTRPTLEGNATIDCFHQFSGVKWLRDKPLSKFNDSQWLLIQKAEEEKLVQVYIKLPESTLNEVITGFNDAYLIDGAGRAAQLWKEQCKLILHDALFNFLLPSMEKEARNLLTSRAKHMLLMEFGKELWKMISVGPYLYNENFVGSVESVAPKVMSCCWGPGNPATTFVMLDSSGELLDVLEARSFNLRSQTIDAQQRKKNDQQNVLKFMKNHQPHVIVIGAANASCVRLKDDVKEIVSKLEENLRDLGQAMNEISVVYGDESLPQLYEHSQVSSDQLPGQPGIVKRAVALGRYLQNPLAMVAALCGVNREIVSWKLSSLEHFLTPDEKYEMIEQVMVDVTNQVGVDINFAVSHDWYFPLLQFVSGLGPQKAALLQREIVGYRAVNNRKELASFGLKTKKVFHNAVGFLCVRGSQLPCTSFDIDLLDGTRIHPESYELAERLAKAVCDDITEAPIEYVKKEPQLLSSFNINDYSATYEIEEGENRRDTFYHIKKELLHGFLDPREPYKVPSLDEEFNMICGKNGTALAEGSLVLAIVRHVESQRAFCVLDSGLTGIIMKDDFSDEDGDFALEDKLHEGDKVSCKVKQIDKSTFQAFLTCKESELKRSRYEDILEVDPYYHESGNILLNQQEKAFMDEKLAKKHFKPRTISHPFFRNMTLDQAMEFLSDKDAGESIFRPSSRGPSYLTLTLKVFDELYVNKDIVESGKDHKDMTSLLHLGKVLKIGNDKFRDLDEVRDRYVIPLVKHLKEMLGFRKFKRGAKSEVDEVLRAEKLEYPMRVVYCFGISYEHPGTFILSYIKSRNLHHEYVGLLPNGFKFRKQTFEKIEHLVGLFQKNIDRLQHTSLTLGNLAFGNSSGACTIGGLQGQLNCSKDRSISRGRSFYHGDGNDDGGKMHPSELPRPHNGSGHDSSNDGFNSFGNEDKDPSQGAAAKWGSCSENQDRRNEKWGRTNNKLGNDIHFAPNNEDWPGGWSDGVGASGRNWDSGDRRGSGGNWDRNDGTRNSGWSKGIGVDRTGGKWGQRGGRGSRGGCTSGWGSTKNGDSSGSDEVWRASGNNVHVRGRPHTSGWGATKESESGGNFGYNEGDWPVSGNNVGGHRHHGGGRGRGCGFRCGHGGSSCWGGTKEGESSASFGGDEGACHTTGNNVWGRGRHGAGCGGGRMSGWGGSKEGESGGTFDGNGEDWHASGNNVGGHGHCGGGRDHGPGRGRAGSWDCDRGGHRGGARNACSFGRGRGRSNERGDNCHRESESGHNSSMVNGGW
ncbi:Transcription elongation factor Spt6 [Theobroma cacao]|nr:Transcription elongation factor Spt6 [Theobroma cacao]